MKYLLSSAVVVLTLCHSYSARADEVTLVAPGGMRCPIERMTPAFERKTGHRVKATIGAGGATHQQVVRGEPFDVPVVQPPYKDVLDSGNVVASSETPHVCDYFASRCGQDDADRKAAAVCRRD